MDKISNKNRNRILVKVAVLAIFPPLFMLLPILVGIVKVPVSLFSPEDSGYFIEYLWEQSYPAAGASPLGLVVRKDGTVRIEVGDTAIWSGKMDESGKYRLHEGDSPDYTLFWMPVPNGIPFLNQREARELRASGLIDVTGFFGPVNAVYSIVVAEHRRDWAATRGSYSIREIRFKSGEAVVGSASYESSTGVLLFAIAYGNRANRLTYIQEKSDFPLGRFRSLMLPFVLIFASALAFYEIFLPSLQKSGGGVSQASEFAFLGYSAALLDFYYDGYYSYYGGETVLLLVHVFLLLLFYFRLGWWAMLPLFEIMIAIFNRATYGSFQPAFAYFPGSFGAWFLVLVFQQTLSPGKIPARKKPAD